MDAGREYHLHTRRTPSAATTAAWRRSDGGQSRSKASACRWAASPQSLRSAGPPAVTPAMMSRTVRSAGCRTCSWRKDTSVLLLLLLLLLLLRLLLLVVHFECSAARYHGMVQLEPQTAAEQQHGIVY